MKIQVLVLAALATYSMNSRAEIAAECIDGAYDFGPGAASLIFRCDDNGEIPPAAMITFCRRKTLLESGECTGAANPIHCSFETTDASWVCTESGDYPFRGVITREAGDRIHYRFKSSFNSGDLTGTRISK